MLCRLEMEFTPSLHQLVASARPLCCKISPSLHPAVQGVFHVADLPLYALSSLVGLLGTWVGDVLANRMSQVGWVV